MRFKRLTPENRRKVNAVARKQCCNYDNGNCILLDNGDICDCPHLISFSLNCKGFRTAVLPNDKELYAKLIIPDCYEITRTGDTVSLVITPSNDKSQLVLKANTIDISNLLMRHTRFNGFVELQTLWNTIYV